MSAEVESSHGETSLTATAVVEKEEKKTNRTEGEEAEKCEKSLTEVKKECQENDKENERSCSGAEAVENDDDEEEEEVVKKVVEAPPPKVNPWTKRTTGRVGIHSSSPQEKGQRVFLIFFKFILKCLVWTEVSSEHVAAAL